MNLKSSQYKQIMRNYDEKQLRNQYELNNRRKEVYLKIPEIKEIDKQISQLSINLTKTLLEKDTAFEELIQKLKEKNLELSMRKIELLHSNGYPKDYLHKNYDCDNCKDTGYVNNKKCSCFKQAIMNISYKQSNINDILKEENFKTFSFNYYSDETDPEYGLSPLKNIHNVYNYCISFVKNFTKQYANIILYGNAGVGKTFISNCIAKEILDKGHTVIYLTAFQLFEIFEKNKFRKSNDSGYDDSLVNDILTCDLLIIDDLGTEFNTNLTNAQLFNCLNTRLITKKSTIISTNLPPSGWSKQYSNRIVSRIFGNYEPLKIFGEDIRIKKAFN